MSDKKEAFKFDFHIFFLNHGWIKSQLKLVGICQYFVLDLCMSYDLVNDYIMLFEYSEKKDFNIM